MAIYAPIIVNADWTSWQVGDPAVWNNVVYTYGTDAFGSIYDYITLTGVAPIPGAVHTAPTDGQVIYIVKGNFKEGDGDIPYSEPAVADPFEPGETAKYTLDFSGEGTTFTGRLVSTATNGVGIRVSSGSVNFGILDDDPTTITLKKDKSVYTHSNSDFVVGGAAVATALTDATATVTNTNLSVQGWVWVGSAWGVNETMDDPIKNHLIVASSTVSGTTLQVRRTGDLVVTDSEFTFADMVLRNNATFSATSNTTTSILTLNGGGTSNIYGENYTSATLTLNDSTFNAYCTLNVGKPDGDNNNPHTETTEDDDFERAGAIILNGSDLVMKKQTGDDPVTYAYYDLNVKENGTLTLDAASTVEAGAITNDGTVNITIDGSTRDQITATMFTNTGTISIDGALPETVKVLRVIKGSATQDQIAGTIEIDEEAFDGYRAQNGFLAVYKGLETGTLLISSNPDVDQTNNFADTIDDEAYGGSKYYVAFTAFDNVVDGLTAGYANTNTLVFDGTGLAESFAYAGITNAAISGLTFDVVGDNDVTVTLTQEEGTLPNTYRIANGFTVEEGVTFTADKMFQQSGNTEINGTLNMAGDDIYLVNGGSITVTGTLTGLGSLALKTVDNDNPVTLTVTEDAVIDELGVLDLGANAIATIGTKNAVIKEINMRPVYEGQEKPVLDLVAGATVTVTDKLSSDFGVIGMALDVDANDKPVASVIQVNTPTATIAGGTINLSVNSEALEGEDAQPFYKLVYGKLGADVTVNCYVDDAEDPVTPTDAQSGKINDDYSYTSLNGRGLFIMKSSLMDTIYVDNTWVEGTEPGQYTFGDTILNPEALAGNAFFKVNAFSKIKVTNNDTDDNGITTKGNGVGQGETPYQAKNIVIFDGTYEGNSKDFYYTNNLDEVDEDGNVTTAAVTISAGGKPTDQSELITNTVIFESERFYLSHAITVHEDLGETYSTDYQEVIDAEIEAGKVPTYCIDEGLTLQIGADGNGRLNIGNAMDKGDSADRTIGIANLIVDGTVKGQLYLTPYTKVDVSTTGKVIGVEPYREANTLHESMTNFKPGAQLTVTGLGKDADYNGDEEGKGYQFYQSGLNILDGGSATFENTSVKLGYIWLHHAADNTLDATDSVFTFKDSKLDINSETGYTQTEFFLDLNGSDGYDFTLNFDGSDVKFLEPTAPIQRAFNPTAQVTVNFTNNATLTATTIRNSGEINVTNSVITVTDSVAHYTNIYNEQPVEVSKTFTASFKNEGTLNLNDGAVVEGDITNLKTGDLFYVTKDSDYNDVDVFATSTGVINLDGTVKVGTTTVEPVMWDNPDDDTDDLVPKYIEDVPVTEEVFTAGTITNNGTINVLGAVEAVVGQPAQGEPNDPNYVPATEAVEGRDAANATLIGKINNDGGTIQVDGTLTLDSEGLAVGEDNITNNGTFKIYGTVTGGTIRTKNNDNKYVSVYGNASLDSLVIGDTRTKNGIRFYGVEGQTEAAQFDLANAKATSISVSLKGIVNLTQGADAATDVALTLGGSGANNWGTAYIDDDVTLDGVTVNRNSALTVNAGKTLTVTTLVDNQEKGTVTLKDGATLISKITNEGTVDIEATTGENVTTISKLVTNKAKGTINVDGKAKFNVGVANSGTVVLNTTEISGQKAVANATAGDLPVYATIDGGVVELGNAVTAFDWGFADITVGDDSAAVLTKVYGAEVVVKGASGTTQAPVPGTTVSLSDSGTVANDSNALTIEAGGKATYTTGLTVAGLEIEEGGTLSATLTLSSDPDTATPVLTVTEDWDVAGAITFTVADDWFTKITGKTLVIDASGVDGDVSFAKVTATNGTLTQVDKKLYLDPTGLIKVSATHDAIAADGWYKTIGGGRDAAAAATTQKEVYILDGDFSSEGSGFVFLNDVKTKVIGGAGYAAGAVNPPKLASNILAAGKNVKTATAQTAGFNVYTVATNHVIKATEGDTSLTINSCATAGNIVGGDFFYYDAAQTQYFYRDGEMNLTINGGKFEVATDGGQRTINGGLYYYGGKTVVNNKSVYDKANGTATIIGNVNLTISGGTFKGYDVYGGNAATVKKLGKYTMIDGSVTLTLDARENALTFATNTDGSEGGKIYAGSYGAGTITGDVTVILTGDEDITLEKLFGGSTGDFRGANHKLDSCVEGARILSFTGFTGNLTNNNDDEPATPVIDGFNTVVFSGVNELKNIDVSGSYFNLDVTNWVFNADASFTNATNFAFDFTGDKVDMTALTNGIVLKNVTMTQADLANVAIADGLSKTYEAGVLTIA